MGKKRVGAQWPIWQIEAGAKRRAGMPGKLEPLRIECHGNDPPLQISILHLQRLPPRRKSSSFEFLVSVARGAQPVARETARVFPRSPAYPQGTSELL
ncbi:hypothetical protein EME01_28530 [Sinorhizobium meliloti]|nr:hypothetical protein EME01_28530 [Sinorhizobium meliloti]